MTRRALIVAALMLALTPGAHGQSSLDAFFKAIEGGDTKTVTGLLERGLDPNSTDALGMSVLMIAARLGHKDIVAVLLGHKASLTLRSPHGDTAILFASLKGHLEVVKLLVERGAPVNDAGWSPLQYAAFEGHAGVVKYLLENGADKNALAPNRYSALMLAVRGSHFEAARALLHEDADYGIKGPGGETALGIARSRKDLKMEELLRRAGAYE